MINFIESFREIYCTKVNCIAPFNAAIYDISSRTNGISSTRFCLKAKLIFCHYRERAKFIKNAVLKNFGQNRTYGNTTKIITG